MEVLKDKIWTGWLAAIFVVIHFVFIFFYALPPQLVGDQLAKIAAPYIEPVFTQKWSMFAPCPTVNMDIEIQFFFENDSTTWIVPNKEVKKKHALYRGSYHGDLVIAEANLGYWLELDLKHFDIQGDTLISTENIADFKKGYSYYKIKKYIYGYGLYLYDKEVTKARFRCFKTDLTKGSHEKIEFPMFNFRP